MLEQLDKNLANKAILEPWTQDLHLRWIRRESKLKTVAWFVTENGIFLAKIDTLDYTGITLPIKIADRLDNLKQTLSVNIGISSYVIVDVKQWLPQSKTPLKSCSCTLIWHLKSLLFPLPCCDISPKFSNIGSFNNFEKNVKKATEGKQNLANLLWVAVS